MILMLLDSSCTSVLTTVSIFTAQSRKTIIPSRVRIVKEFFATNRDDFPPKEMQPLLCARNPKTLY